VHANGTIEREAINYTLYNVYKKYVLFMRVIMLHEDNLFTDDRHGSEQDQYIN
jgi:hypothetical protein